MYGEAQGGALVSPGRMRFLERKRRKGETKVYWKSRVSDSNYVSTESHMTRHTVIVRLGSARYSSLQRDPRSATEY